jgi:hypothetical protein
MTPAYRSVLQMTIGHAAVVANRAARAARDCAGRKAVKVNGWTGLGLAFSRQARAHDGRRRDGDQRTGQGLGVYGAPAGGSDTVVKPQTRRPRPLPNVRVGSNWTEWAQGHTSFHFRSTLNPDREFSASVSVALCP